MFLLLADTAMKAKWGSEVIYVMTMCFSFLTRKWNIYGWHISIFECAILAEAFYVCMNFIARLMGKEEVFGNDE